MFKNDECDREIGMTKTAEPHGYITKTIHWLAAGLVGYGYLKGLNNVGQLDDPLLLRSEVIFALVLGAVFVLRLIWTKWIAGTTRVPDDAPAWESTASRLVHIGLYASVFGIVLSGLGIALGVSVPILSGIFVTGMVGLHEFFLALMPILLVIHVAGALWHKFIRKDGVLESMTGRVPGSLGYKKNPSQ